MQKEVQEVREEVGEKYILEEKVVEEVLEVV